MEIPTDDGSDSPSVGNFTTDQNVIDHHFTCPTYSCTSILKRSILFLERWVELVMVSSVT